MQPALVLLTHGMSEADLANPNNAVYVPLTVMSTSPPDVQMAPTPRLKCQWANLKRTGVLFLPS